MRVQVNGLDSMYSCCIVGGMETTTDPYDNDVLENLGLGDDDGIVYVEVELPDGSTARWARELDDATTDALTNAIESVLGSPDTLML